MLDLVFSEHPMEHWNFDSGIQKSSPHLLSWNHYSLKSNKIDLNIVQTLLLDNFIVENLVQKLVIQLSFIRSSICSS